MPASASMKIRQDDPGSLCGDAMIDSASQKQFSHIACFSDELLVICSALSQLTH
ncbi:MAG TPA: hypothetical protein VNU72_06175 [Puia sp.]|jgi:hypothetical protein|nr:hypothetical protein [Puia sp.]